MTRDEREGAVAWVCSRTTRRERAVAAVALAVGLSVGMWLGLWSVPASALSVPIEGREFGGPLYRPVTLTFIVGPLVFLLGGVWYAAGQRHNARRQDGGDEQAPEPSGSSNEEVRSAVTDGGQDDAE